MANTKYLNICFLTGSTIYCLIKRMNDSFLMDSSLGTFASNPTNNTLIFLENSIIKGLYENNENRSIWLDGEYRIYYYKQVGGLPNVSNDELFAEQIIQIINDSFLDELTINDISNVLKNTVIEGTLTLQEMLKIMFAVLAGTSSGGGSSTITFKGVDGITTRVSAQVDGNGNRTIVVTNGV